MFGYSASTVNAKYHILICKTVLIIIELLPTGCRFLGCYYLLYVEDTGALVLSTVHMFTMGQMILLCGDVLCMHVCARSSFTMKSTMRSQIEQ